MGSCVFVFVRNLAAKRLKGGNNENQLGFPWIWKAVGIEIFFLIELNSNLWYFASTGICDKMLGRDCKERLDIQFIISHRLEKKDHRHRIGTKIWPSFKSQCRQQCYFGQYLIKWPTYFSMSMLMKIPPIENWWMIDACTEDQIHFLMLHHMTSVQSYSI